MSVEYLSDEMMGCCYWIVPVEYSPVEEMGEAEAKADMEVVVE